MRWKMNLANPQVWPKIWMIWSSPLQDKDLPNFYFIDLVYFSVQKSPELVYFTACVLPRYIFLVVVPKSLEQRNLYQIQADNSSSNKFICSSSVSLSHNSILAHSLLSICCRFAVPYLTIIVLLHNSLSRWVKCFHQTQQQTLIERGFEPATHQLQDKLLPPSPLVNNNFHF